MRILDHWHQFNKEPLYLIYECTRSSNKKLVSFYSFKRILLFSHADLLRVELDGWSLRKLPKIEAMYT